LPVPLLTTKLYIPSPGRTLVERARLEEKLTRCLEPGCRLALVSAPAGFGKTSLVSAWLAGGALAERGWQAAWLSLDGGDNDPVIFWSYLIAALQTRNPGVGEAMLEMLAAPGDDLQWKLASLINDLAQAPQACLLVLDDYHLVRNPGIHQSLAYFIEHAPAHVHLLIASRTDPPLPLALLRGRGQLLEIRLSDLRFSDEDAGQYLNAGGGLQLEASSVRALNQKTEGWIAGLQMAALALRDNAAQGLPGPAGQARAADFVASFSGSNRFILDYLIEEVLNRQPEPVQQFLVQTSILEQLCAPLCDALLGEDGPGAQATLQHLERSNLFVVPLDQQRYWYRYHHLFADLLRKRLEQSAPERVADLHRRAIHWYEQNGLIPNAIQHAFQLKDYPRAAGLVARVTETMWGRGEHATLLAWMEALPEDARQPYPSLLTFQVSMLIGQGKLKQAEACIPILERHIQAVEQAEPGNAAALRTYIASFRTDWPGVVEHARIALTYLTRAEDAGQRCGVSLILGNACLMQGQLEEAGEAFGEAILAAEAAGKPHMALTGLANLAALRRQQGSLSRAAQACRAGLRLIEESGPNRSPMAVDVWLAWGGVLCQRGNLAEAEAFLNKGLELAEERRMVWQVARGRQARARLLLAQGRVEEAESAARAADEWTGVHPLPAHIESEGASLLAEVWMRQGKIVQAGHYLQARRVEAQDEIHFPRQWEALALARWMWLNGEDGTAELAERIAGWAEARQHTGVWMASLILQALIRQSHGDREQALPALSRALELAEPEGCVQAFVDEGEAMRGLLRAALEREIQPAFSARVLAAFPGEPAAEPPARAARPAEPSNAAVPLAEPLSRRETEILQLIAAGLSNKEIAQKLYISLRTVKYYSTGLYNKLGVDSRMQAVIRAREIGLL